MAAWMARGERSSAYRRRRPLPGIAFLVVLLLGAGLVWVTLLGNSKEMDSATCNAPEAQPGVTVPERQSLPRNALDKVEPVPANRVRVTVLNAGGQRGEATLVTLTLQELGFNRSGEAGDDPLYPDQDMQCRAEIRFGEAGVVAARTMSLIEPCAVLVRDDRKDTSIDLVVGERFDDLDPNPAGEQVLDLLKSGATVSGGGEQADSGGIDRALLQRARDVNC